MSDGRGQYLSSSGASSREIGWLPGQRGRSGDCQDGHVAILKPVRRRSVADAVFERLRDGILVGEFPPGSRLPGELALSEKLQVNRGAVREALKRLSDKGLVSVQRRGATRVLDVKASAELDLLPELLAPEGRALDLGLTRSFVELQSAIHSDLARLAAQRGGPKLADRLAVVLADMRSARGDLSGLQALSETFWEILVGASENVAYELVLNTLHAIHRRHRDLLRPFVSHQYRDASGFEAIGRAVVDADSEQAVQAVRQHAEFTVRAIADARSAEVRSQN